jgi:hypothetical protein
MKKALVVLAVVFSLVVCGSAHAGIISFADWKVSPQTVDNVTYTLSDYSDAFETDGRVNYPG